MLVVIAAVAASALAIGYFLGRWARHVTARTCDDCRRSLVCPTCNYVRTDRTRREAL